MSTECQRQYLKPVVGSVAIKKKVAVGSYDFPGLKWQRNGNIGNYTLIYMAPAVGIVAIY